MSLISVGGIGDADSLVTEENVGARVTDFKDDEYGKVAAVIEKLEHVPENTRRLMRLVAERLFDVRTVGVAGYLRLYEKVFER